MIARPSLHMLTHCKRVLLNVLRRATGFPFSVVSHAQYTGMCIFVTCWNAFMATERHVAAGMFNLTAVQVFYYVGMALVEDYL